MAKHNTNTLVGRKVRMLTVIKFSHIKQIPQKDRLRNRYVYECLCDCGNTTLVASNNLSTKVSPSSTWSCGCWQKAQSIKGHEKQRGIPRPSVQKPNGYSIMHASYLTYKGVALRKSLSWQLTEMIFADITAKNCYYCDAEPTEKKRKLEFVTRKLNGIDRLDSNLGYEASNCVPCCKICNYMKQELSEQGFYEHMVKVLKFKNIKVI